LTAFPNVPPAGPFWVVPVEMAIALAPLAVCATLVSRRARGDGPNPHCTVFRRNGQMVAVVDFARGSQLQFHLVVTIEENG
jgi:hypothetical protein